MKFEIYRYLDIYPFGIVVDTSSYEMECYLKGPKELREANM